MCSKQPGVRRAAPADPPEPAKPRTLTRRRLLRRILAGGAAAVVAGGATGYYTTRFPAGAAHSGWLALRGVTALSGEGLAPVRDAIVLVQDGQIVEVGSRLEIPQGAEVLDAPGATVLPGLIDMHTHLTFPEVEPGEEFTLTDMPGYFWDVARYQPSGRRAYLEHGVTTVRDLGNELTWVRELRTALTDGTLEGPRLFFAGPTLTTPGGHPISTFDISADSDGIRIPGNPQQATEIVAELCDGDDPVDVIKVIQESGAADRRLDPHTPEVLTAIVEAAHARGVPVTAHCGTVTDLTQAVHAGVDGVEHLSLRNPSSTFAQGAQTAATAWPRTVLDQMAARGVRLDPTLVVELGDPADQPAQRTEQAERVYERMVQAHAAGIPILAGSDAAVPGMGFGSGLIREIQALGLAGLSNRDALRGATTLAAAALQSDQIGVLEPGRAADLLVLDGDPSHDLTALHEVIAVLRDGRMVTGEIEAG